MYAAACKLTCLPPLYQAVEFLSDIPFCSNLRRLKASEHLRGKTAINSGGSSLPSR